MKHTDNNDGAEKSSSSICSELFQSIDKREQSILREVISGRLFFNRKDFWERIYESSSGFSSTKNNHRGGVNDFPKSALVRITSLVIFSK
jgi:hypothetical protein